MKLPGLREIVFVAASAVLPACPSQPTQSLQQQNTEHKDCYAISEEVRQGILEFFNSLSFTTGHRDSLKDAREAADVSTYVLADCITNRQ